MASILKVDTIQDQAGNNIISENANVITIGASGDTITVPAGATVSGFTSAGIDDNATSTAITIDSSENVGIGTSSPTQKLDVNGTVKATSFSGDGSGLSGVTSVGGDTGVDFNDNVKARFGTGNDLEIYHEGSHSFIDDVGTGRLYLRGNDGVYIQRYTGEDMIKAIANGAVNLYYDNSLKLETTTNGVTITGGTNDTLRLTNDDAGSGTAPDIVMYRNSSSPADNDNLGLVEFTGNQSNGSEHTYAYIRAVATDVTAGTEDAEIDFAVSKAGTATIIASVTNAGFVPQTTDTYDLGSSSLVWRNIYTGDLHLSNEAKSEGNSVDGTKGNWTIQEGAEDLYILNNKTGKKFKFKLEEMN